MKNVKTTTAKALKMGAKVVSTGKQIDNGTLMLVYIVIENGEILQVFDNERVAKFYIGAQSVKRQKAMKIVEKIVKSNLGE